MPDGGRITIETSNSHLDEDTRHRIREPPPANMSWSP